MGNSKHFGDLVQSVSKSKTVKSFYLLFIHKRTPNLNTLPMLLIPYKVVDIVDTKRQKDFKSHRATNNLSPHCPQLSGSS